MANLESISRLAETDGVLAVDKPVGLSAHDAMKALKTHFNIVKVGHGGTLDATASGLFLVLLGDATRLSAGLMADNRAWTARFRFGRSTDTFDAAGRTRAERPFADATRERLDAVLKEFRGDIYQAPPAFSAVKLPDRAEYEIIETAKGDELRERLVHVFRLAVTGFEPPFADFEIRTTKNANIRSLADAIGEALGCGACVEEMRRTACGKFTVDEATPFMELLKLDAVALRERVIPLSSVSARS